MKERKLREKMERGNGRKKEGGREREGTKEAVCGERGRETPSETNKKWNNNKSQKALPPLLFLTHTHTHIQHTHNTHTNNTHNTHTHHHSFDFPLFSVTQL